MANTFVVVAGTMVITPGAGFVLFMSTAMTRGRSAALALGTGIISGTVLLATIAIAVFPPLRALIPGVVGPLRIIGGLYLVFLGLKNIWSRGRAMNHLTGHANITSFNWLSEFGQDVLSALTNPGLLVMYFSLLPSFVPTGRPWRLIASQLALQHVAMVTAWYLVLFVVATRYGVLFATPKRQRIISVFAGITLIVLGIRTASPEQFRSLLASM